jgi:quinol monooxygenase YgiN
MQALVVEFRIEAAFVDDFAAAIEANARASLVREPGCRQFDVCRDAADPALFFLYELYDDEAAIAAHLRSPHFLAMDELTRGWVATKTVRRLHRSVP